MMSRFVRCDGVVLVRPLGPHAWRARLPNGHELAAIVPRPPAGHPAMALEAGHTVTLELSPADFSQGRIVLE